MAKNLVGGEKDSVYSGGVNPLVFAAVPSNSSVLDVGCADGALGVALSKEKGCLVVGIEYSQLLAASASKKLSKVIRLDIERDKIPLKPSSFDVLVLADVLEHTREPGAVLSRLLPLVRKGGIVVVSVPNVANFSIRLKLLFGNWNYQKQGILDSSHLRFFTLRTSRQLLENAGLSVVSVSATRNALSLLFLQKLFDFAGLLPFYSSVDSFLANAYKPLFAQQLVFTSEKK